MKNIKLIILLAILSSCNAQIENANDIESGTDSVSTIYNNPVYEQDGIIYFSKNNGLSWENHSEGLPGKATLGLGGIAVSDTSLAVAIKGAGIYFFDFVNNRWNSIPTDKQILENNLGPLILYKDGIYVGTEKGGVYFTQNRGKDWTSLNKGLGNSSIRRFREIDNKLYAGTNAGLYVYRGPLNGWNLEHGNNTMQVNGITAFDGCIFIGTNQGVFIKLKGQTNWIPALQDYSIHNINSNGKTIYAMSYNELFSSTDNGQTWKNIQRGLPAELYTFNVIKNDDFVFAAQWDGVYRKGEASENWVAYSRGLPIKYAVPNIVSYNGMIVAGGSERGLKKGMTRLLIPLWPTSKCYHSEPTPKKWGIMQ